MEIITGKISIKKIFMHHGAWFSFWLKYALLMRWSVIWNVYKMILCRNGWGHTVYNCPECNTVRRVPHTCKSRFCNTCGKAAVDRWVDKSLTELLDTSYKHLVFTIPEELRIWIRKNRKEGLDLLFKAAKNTILKYAEKRGFRPGIMSILHTFGGVLNWNPHIHVIITAGGLSENTKSWIKNTYFPQKMIRPMYQYEFLRLLKKSFKEGNISPPKKFKAVKNDKIFNSYLSQFYKKHWYVYFGKELKEVEATVKYSGRYGKRPVIAESKILAFNGKYVTFEYNDRANNKLSKLSLTIYDFIKRLIIHIPDENFRMIRHSGIFANRVKTKLLEVAEKILMLKKKLHSKTTWREMYRKAFKTDPLECPFCGATMIATSIEPIETAEIKRRCQAINWKFKERCPAV